MWKEVQRTRKKEVLSSHFVESSRPSLTTVRLEIREAIDDNNLICHIYIGLPFLFPHLANK